MGKLRERNVITNSISDPVDTSHSTVARAVKVPSVIGKKKSWVISRGTHGNAVPIVKMPKNSRKQRVLASIFTANSTFLLH